MLPEVIAFEGPRLLTRDAGSRLRTRLDSGGRAPSWEELWSARGAAARARPAVGELALGVSTPGPNGWRSCRRAFQAMTGDAAIRHAVAGLGSASPDQVVHTEAHDGNFFIAANDHVRLPDWAEAVGPHPFVGTVLPLRFAVERRGSSPERLRDAYLEPFISLAPLTELQESFSHGYLLGALVRALTWAALDVPREVSAELGDPVPAWLEIFDGIAAGIITSGGMTPAAVMSLGLSPTKGGAASARARGADGARPDTILLLEHPPTVTTGRRTEESELHIPAGAVVDVVETNRGGKSTFHGPGQLVATRSST